METIVQVPKTEGNAKVVSEKTFCPNCFHTLSGMDYFCPFCGKQIKEKPVDLSVLKQLSVYLVSFLLPPAGLWPAYTYLKVHDPKARRIGLIALVLTVISVVISIYLLTGLVNTVNTKINDQINSGLLGN